MRCDVRRRGRRREKQQTVTNNKIHPIRLQVGIQATSVSPHHLTSHPPMTKRPHSPNTLIFNNMAEPTEGREPKRRRSAPLPLDINVALSMKPEKNIDVVDDGDVLLVVNKFNDEEKP